MPICSRWASFWIKNDKKNPCLILVWYAKIAALHPHLVASPFHLLTMRHDTAQKTKREYGSWQFPAPFVSQIVGEFLDPLQKASKTMESRLHISTTPAHLKVAKYISVLTILTGNGPASFGITMLVSWMAWIQQKDREQEEAIPLSKPPWVAPQLASAYWEASATSISISMALRISLPSSQNLRTPGVGLWADISHIVGAQHTERPDRKHSDTKSHKCRHVILLVSMPSGENPWIHK